MTESRGSFAENGVPSQLEEAPDELKAISIEAEVSSTYSLAMQQKFLSLTG
jgi:hypothetical protein